MSGSQPFEDVALANERTLERLAWAIDTFSGQFALILARCNYSTLRSQLIERLTVLCSVELRTIVLQESTTAIYTAIQKKLGDEHVEALMVFGLESLQDLDRALTSTNQVREEFRRNFEFPLVLWVNDEILRKLVRLAPDFTNWATTTEFSFSTETLNEELRKRADHLFMKVLELDTNPFVSNDVILGANYRQETRIALRDLRENGQEPSPDLLASIEFARGREDYINGAIEKALTHYQKSLAFWRQIQHQERQGILLVHIGLCHVRQAELALFNDRQYWEEARDTFEQSLAIFTQAQRQDLVAQFINNLGEVLQHLEAWEELQNLAQSCLTLHTTYKNPAHLAQAYGFWAELALHQSHWQEANQAAQTALEVMANASGEQQQNYSYYRLLLAISQQQLGQHTEAIDNLERARRYGAQGDPQLYIQIPDTLRLLYFEQKQYLEAFRLKQERRSIQQQYGFRAFVGASRLKPQRQVGATISKTSHQEMVAQEITASNRRQNVDELTKRIRDEKQHQLIVIYGQSGVGKSSVVEAGLVPALPQRPSGTRDVVPVLLRVYTDWIKGLGNSLAQALEETDISNQLTVESLNLDTIEYQLRWNEEHNLLTVLIFDQFEEFFFVCKKTDEQKQFFRFLRDCLKLSSVKVILSMREDYLHLLLRGSQTVELNATDQAILGNILDRRILYRIGNLSREETKSIIRSLTKRSQVQLEAGLIDELVKDLADELGEVRPIELQVVGAQLQAENIRTLTQYGKLAQDYKTGRPKETLVQRYLGTVVEDCGSENQRAAELVLYLLTDENNTRPLKTRAELDIELKTLAADLAAEASLGLVLDIFVESGLVVLLKETPADHYQLVHDYLVSFIRHQQEPLIKELTAKLEEQTRLREQAEAQRRQVQAELNEAEKAKQAIEVQHRQAQKDLKRTERAKKIGYIVLGITSIAAAIAIVSGTRATTSKTETERTVRELGLRIEQVGTKLSDQEIQLRKKGEELREKDEELKNKRKNLQQTQENLKDKSREEREARRRLEGVNQQAAAATKRADQANEEQKQAQLISDALESQTLLFTENPIEGLLRTIEVTSRSLSIPSDKVPKQAKGILHKALEVSREKQLLERHKGDTYVAISRDGNVIASGDGEGNIRFWNNRGIPIGTYPSLVLKEKILAMAVSPNGQTIISGSDNGVVRFWNREGRQIGNIERKHEAAIRSIAVSQVGQVISLDEAGEAWIWNQQGEAIEKHNFQPEVKTDPSFRSVAISPDGQTVICTIGNSKQIQVWERSSSIQPVEPIMTNSIINSISFSSGGGFFVTSGNSGDITLWNAETFDPLDNPKFNHNSPVDSVAISDDGLIIASGGTDGTVKVWRRQATGGVPQG